MSRIAEVRYHNATLSDVAYTHEFEGSFNITRALADIASGALKPLRARCPILPSHVEANARADIHEPTVRKMTPERGDQPLLVFMCRDGTGFVADGNNRLRWRIEHGLEDFKALIVGFEEREKYRIETWVRFEGSNEWEKVDEAKLLALSIGQHRPEAGI